MLEAIEGKDLGQKFLLGMITGVIKGQIRFFFFFLDSTFDPSAIDRIAHPTRGTKFMIACTFQDSAVLTDSYHLTSPVLTGGNI